jgi:hypothetical protein
LVVGRPSLVVRRASSVVRRWSSPKTWRVLQLSDQIRADQQSTVNDQQRLCYV